MSPASHILPEDSASDPLSFAVQDRDARTLQMVETAVAHGNVVQAYQPIVSAQRPDRPAFYEGLARILDPTGRVIPARDFIEVVEKLELGRQIDVISLRLGLQALADYPGLRLSVNMSARSIGYAPWLDELNIGLARDDTVAERLILEITESSAMVLPKQVSQFMSSLQRRGICFALDDFGSGYTSFKYLRDFMFDIVKIDGQFIRDIRNNPDNQVLTEALVMISRQFDMLTVAEFVETAEDAQFLAEMGVDCLQGYYFGAPSLQPHWSERRQRVG